MAAVGVKGLTDILLLFFSVSNLDAADLNKPRVEVEFNASPNNTSEWVSSVLRRRQHSIGYMGDGFYRSKDPTNSIKVLKEMLQKTKKTTKTTKLLNTHMHRQSCRQKGYTQNKHSKSPSLH